MNDLVEFQKARIEALIKLNEMQSKLIDELTFRNDELIFDCSNAKAKYNMLVRNIEVIDSITGQPLN